MSKKARMRRSPQKYVKKFGSHSYFIAKHNDKPAEPVVEEAIVMAVPEPAAEPIPVKPAPVKPKAVKKKPAPKKQAAKKPATKRATTKQVKRAPVKKDQ